MTLRTVTVAAVAIAFVALSGCVAPSVDPKPVIITANASAELQKRQAAGKASWTVAYNGLCAGAPALGFFQRFEPAGKDDATRTVNGVEFVIEREVMDLTGEWGDIFIRCIHPASGEVTAEFAAQAPPQAQ